MLPPLAHVAAVIVFAVILNSSVAFEAAGTPPPTHKPAGCVPEPDVSNLPVAIFADVAQLVPSYNSVCAVIAGVANSPPKPDAAV